MSRILKIRFFVSKCYSEKNLPRHYSCFFSSWIPSFEPRFIDSAELRTMYGRDVMFIPSMVGGKEVFNEMEVGTAVRFSVQFENGQPKACEVRAPNKECW